MIRRKLLAAARLARPVLARNGRALPRAWFMTDPKRVSRPERIAANLPPGLGVIYRHFNSKDRFSEGEALARICKRRRLILLVSADPELARRLGADGVHWPEARLRGVRPHNPRWIETASAHSRRAITRAARMDIDAVLVSAAFASASVSAGAPIGVARFRILTRDARLPLYALDGITHANAARVMAHAAGWAAVDAILTGWSA